MRILSCRVFPYTLPLRPGWHSARGSMTSRAGALLRLESDGGACGWGDCAPLQPGDEVRRLAEWSKQLPGQDAAVVRGRLAGAGLDPAVACAVDTALADLAAQQAGLPLARWLAPDARPVVRCNAIVGPLDQTAAERALSAARAGFSVLKLKVGLDAVAKELPRLHRLMRLLPAGVSLRLDANGAWSPDQARRFLDGARGLPLDMIEEPLAVPHLGLLRALQDGTDVALALDESLPALGLAAVIAACPVRRLVLKPMLLGGLAASLEWARLAAERGMQCIVTTTVDSAVGTLAAAHLAAALNNGQHHGLATASWLMRDLGPVPEAANGRMELDDRPGLGFLPYRQAINS